MTKPAVIGVLETALYVRDLNTSQRFYERVLGFVETFREVGRLHALRIPGGQVLLLFEIGKSTHPKDTPAGRIPSHGGHGILHVAFEIEPANIEAWRRHLQAAGVEIESEVECPRGGRSMYFRDPDGHLIELVTRSCWGD